MSGRRRPSPPHPSLPLAWPPADPVVPLPRLSGPPWASPGGPLPTKIALSREPREVCKTPNTVYRPSGDPQARTGRGCSGKSCLFAPTGPARPAEPRRSLPPSHHTVGRAGFCGGGGSQTNTRGKISVGPTPTLKAQLSFCHSLVTNRLNCCEFGKTHRDSLDTVVVEDLEIVTIKRAL